MTCVELNSRILSLAVMMTLLLGSGARAQEVMFSEEELPAEAVTPRLDTPKAVLSRKLSFEKRFQADLAGGYLLDEAFYNNQFVGVQGTYSWNEMSSAGLRYITFGSGLSDYSKQFETSVANPPKFNGNVGPKNGFIGFYERRMMYGKVSVSKHHVIPALLTWSLEGGMIKYGSTRQLPLLGASISNRYFLTQHFGVSLGIHGYFRQLVDPLSADLRTTPAPAEGDFSTTTKFSTALDLSISYLF
jgi:hypothetical protein